MQLTCCRNIAVAATLMMGTIFPSTGQAGLIPWAYNAVFGPSPTYAYGAPAYYGVGYRGTYAMSSYYSPAWSTYTAGYAPAFSYDSFGAVGTYGYANPCAPCGCASCGCVGGCASGNCTSGNCASGNCGAGYAPDINNGPTPEPTQVTPNPPAANPPAEAPPRSSPPIDDFTRVPPRTNDSTIPDSNRNTTPNSSTIPNSSTVPSTIPERTIPNAIPDTNNSPSAPPFNNNNSTDSLFERPTLERTPAPVEPVNPGSATPGSPPGSTDVLPLGTGILPAPLDLDSVPVASIHIQRQRIVTRAGYHTLAVSRVPVAPHLTPVQELAHK